MPARSTGMLHRPDSTVLGWLGLTSWLPGLTAWLTHYAALCMQEELAQILKDYVGRESPLYHAERLSEYYRKCAAVCLRS